MGIFKNLGTEELEQPEDRIGGYSPLDSDAYPGEITLAYAGKSPKGAMNVTVHAKLENGQEYRETVYITSQKGENFWTNDNNKKVPLPGFTVINDLCICATDAPLNEQPTEEKVVKLYDFEERKELPKSVDVLVDLIGKPITLGIMKTLENKNAKQGDGSYAPTAEEREVNNIDKVFHEPSKMTVAEAVANEGWDADKAEFITKWTDRNKGRVADKRKIKDGQGGTSGKPGAPTSGGGGERKSLFGKKD